MTIKSKQNGAGNRIESALFGHPFTSLVFCLKKIALFGVEKNEGENRQQEKGFIIH
jgi:hypothetical protein